MTVLLWVLGAIAFFNGLLLALIALAVAHDAVKERRHERHHAEHMAVELGRLEAWLTTQEGAER